MNLLWKGESDWVLAGGPRAARRGVAPGPPQAIVGGQFGAELRRGGIATAIEQVQVPSKCDSIHHWDITFSIKSPLRLRLTLFGKTKRH
jgi:hypothetical protein